jgi:oxygen-independent coproporphyrinogen-3 oxidase
MYSLPGQTMDILKQSVHDAIALKPAHLSLYSLTVEANTVFGRTGVSSLDEETEADMYEWICQTLPARGYHQYEISNFALPGYESRHNLTYWHYDDFIGLGCGASGKENHARYDHTRNLKQYFEHPAYRKMIPLTMEDEQFEMVMMNLRLKQGMKLADYQAKFKEDYHVRFGLKTEELKRKGLLEETDGFIRATGRGYEILNSVLVELM